MSEEWDSVTRIGKKSGHNASGGGGDFERVVKSQSQLNAMKRSGAAISTEKKFGGSNSKGDNTTGQHLTKVDRDDAPTAPKTVGPELGKIISQKRQEMNPKLSQKDLGNKINQSQTVVQSYENGTAVPNQQILGSMEKILGIKLRGSDIGAPRFGPKK